MSLSEGTTWTYVGIVKWTVGNSNETRSKQVKWTTWVERSSTIGTKTVAVVRGLPLELAWYEPGQEPGYAVVIQDQTYLRVEMCSDRAEAEKTMSIATQDEQIGTKILKFPIQVGVCLADEEQSERTDKRYCWLVESELREKRGRGWRLVYRTAPDHQILNILHGIGITRYVFEHHGTTASADVRLTSVVANPSAGATQPTYGDAKH